MSAPGTPLPDSLVDLLSIPPAAAAEDPEDLSFADLLLQTNPSSQLKAFPCLLCDKSFDIDSELTRHVSLMHNPAVRHAVECPFCDKPFSDRGQVRRHMTLVHREERTFACETCGKTFKLKYMLQRHQQTHSQSQRDDQQCSVCGKRGFRDGSTLKRHMSSHLDTRPHACVLCGKTFKQRSHLLQHQSICAKRAAATTTNMSQVTPI